MPTPNVELLRRTLSYIQTHPNRWNQRIWRLQGPCQTTMCFAGTACDLAGGLWVGPHHLLLAEPGDEPAYKADGWTPAHARARRLLGLTEEQANDLFHGANNLHMLEQIVEELCANA